MKDLFTSRNRRRLPRFSPTILRGALLLIAVLCLQFPALAQTISVSGTVSDATGEPLMGATIQVVGTSNAVAADLDGNFTLNNVDPKGKLNVSYIGCKPQVIAIEGRTHIDVTLQEDSEVLDEVVVVGYGTMKKSDLTGSVASVGTETLNAKGAPSVLENLQGTSPGVNITKSTGRANGGMDIQIRGKSSINSSTTPLYVVDGIMCDDIDFLNPQDIERIDILKDASSTAIYGSRATAGVVMITTKGGLNVKKDEKATITYDGYYGINQVARMPEFAMGRAAYNYRFLKFHEPVGGIYGPQNVYSIATPTLFGQALLQRDNADIKSTFALKELLANNEVYDWPSLVTRNGHQQNHYVGVSGSSDKVNYHFGVGLNSEEGIYTGDSNLMYNMKGSVDARINSVISAGFNFNLSYREEEFADDDAISQAYRVCSFFRPYNEDGSINHFPGNAATFGTNGNQFSDFISPLDQLKNSTRQSKRYRALGNMYLQLDIIKGLYVKSTFSPTFNHGRYGTYTGYVNPATGLTYNDKNPEEAASASYGQSTGMSWIWDNIINWNKDFGKDHSVSLMGLFSMERGYTEKSDITATGVLENTDWWNMGSGTIGAGVTSVKGSSSGQSGVGTSYGETAMTSFALRANYNFKNRYMLTATVRWDGSAKFAHGHRWGSFPSAAFAWRASEEAFLRDVDWLSNLKLRLAYGRTGNNKGVGSYQYMVGINGGVYYPFGTAYASGLYPGGVVDADITWETSDEFNAGLDFGFINNRIFGNVDFYTKNSHGLLYDVTLPYVSGGGKMKTNIGQVRNVGVEVSLTTMNIVTRDWEWQTTFTFAHNKNTVREINGETDALINGTTGSLFVGQPYAALYGYENGGIVSDLNMTVPDNEAARNAGFTPGTTVRECDYYYAVYGLSEGMPYVKDTNGDGKITEDDKIIYNGDPDWTGGISSSLTYRLPKNGGMIDFGFNFYFNIGNKVYSPFMNSDYFDYHDRGRGKMAFDYYIPAGTLIDADYMTADGMFVNPVYQTTTHYGSYPFPNAGSNDGLGNQKSYWDEAKAFVDGSYVKVKNITLGYTFHKNLLKSWGCQNLRLYFTVANPFVFTKYRGFDPEWANASTKQDGPSVISYQIGASIKF